MNFVVDVKVGFRPDLKKEYGDNHGSIVEVFLPWITEMHQIALCSKSLHGT